MPCANVAVTNDAGASSLQISQTSNSRAAASLRSRSSATRSFNGPARRDGYWRLCSWKPQCFRPQDSQEAGNPGTNRWRFSVGSSVLPAAGLGKGGCKAPKSLPVGSGDWAMPCFKLCPPSHGSKKAKENYTGHTIGYGMAFPSQVASTKNPDNAPVGRRRLTSQSTVWSSLNRQGEAMDRPPALSQGTKQRSRSSPGLLRSGCPIQVLRA